MVIYLLRFLLNRLKLFKRLKMKRIICLITGIISTVLGVIGIFLPILPTTPFLLLASFCFLKSSNRLYEKLLNHKILGKYIHDYVKYKSVSLKSKIIAIIMIWISMGISMFLTQKITVVIILSITGFFVTIYLIMLKTRKE